MSNSLHSRQAHSLVTDLQTYFVQGLERASRRAGDAISMEKTSWLRDGGEHGGGSRYGVAGAGVFNRASVNVSQVHYHDLPEKTLAAATALSVIIHPDNPHAASMHMHISWTEMKSGMGYWRMMADLNPAIEYDEDREEFLAALSEAAPGQFEEAVAQGDKYFYIPALDRHRGVAHFYLEAYNSGDFEADETLARLLGAKVIGAYLSILEKALADRKEVTEADRAAQRAYHTLYFFQVLTLDRGTTSGLLVHDQNDLGIMGSIPGMVDRGLLKSWCEKMAPPQDGLLGDLVRQLPETGIVDDGVRCELAATVRAHYKANPDALEQQAKGNIVPPTVKNHR